MEQGSEIELGGESDRDESEERDEKEVVTRSWDVEKVRGGGRSVEEENMKAENEKLKRELDKERRALDEIVNPLLRFSVRNGSSGTVKLNIEAREALGLNRADELVNIEELLAERMNMPPFFSILKERGHISPTDSEDLGLVGAWDDEGEIIDGEKKKPLRDTQFNPVLVDLVVENFDDFVFQDPQLQDSCD